MVQTIRLEYQAGIAPYGFSPSRGRTDSFREQTVHGESVWGRTCHNGVPVFSAETVRSCRGLSDNGGVDHPAPHPGSITAGSVPFRQNETPVSVYGGKSRTCLGQTSRCVKDRYGWRE